ncbi:MAG: protein kinase [Pirellulales bacterium]
MLLARWHWNPRLQGQLDPSDSSARLEAWLDDQQSSPQERGEPHVTDFGLAKRLDEESDLTQAGAIVGTPSYMAPEQAEADNDLTTAVDVYGLGALLYELLTGRPPFKGHTPLETMLAVIAADPAPPRKVHAGIDHDLETICLKCLEKSPHDRYASAEALADDLQRWLAGEPIVARPATALERLFKWSRRQPLMAGSLATVAATGISLLVLAGFLWQNAEARAQAVKNLGEAQTQLAQVDGERQRAERRKSEAEELADQIKGEVDRLQKAASAAQEQLDNARTEARRTLYAADVQLAHAAWQSGNVSSTNELLEKYLPQNDAVGDDPRGFEWHYLWRQTHAARRSWRPETPTSAGVSPLQGIAFSPDGKTVATASISGGAKNIRLWNVADGRLIRTIRLGNVNVTRLASVDERHRIMVTHRKPANCVLCDHQMESCWRWPA